MVKKVQIKEKYIGKKMASTIEAVLAVNLETSFALY
jgi:hypothetical protein